MNDQLLVNLKACDIDHSSWKAKATDRLDWRQLLCYGRGIRESAEAVQDTRKVDATIAEVIKTTARVNYTCDLYV